MDTVSVLPEASPTLDLFDDRYGLGARERLITLLRQPCVTFAQVAAQYGVTRECVRQWHQRLLPDAPSGHARQRLCRLSERKRELFNDALFRAFYRRLRDHLRGSRVVLVPARDGFRKRSVRVDDHMILLRKARRFRSRAHTDPAYILTNSTVAAEFIYFELSESDYLFVPRGALAERVTTFVDTPRSKYRPFKNTFVALVQKEEVRRKEEEVRRKDEEGGPAVTVQIAESLSEEAVGA